MYLLKKIFKNKNKPFFSKVANDKFEKMFIIDLDKIQKSKNPEIVGIVQEISDGEAIVVSGIYSDNSYIHIRKDGKITEFKISTKSLLKSKKKVFDLSVQNFNQIKEYDNWENSFLRERGIRMTFLTSKGIYRFKGQFDDFNKGLFLPHISSMFTNILLSFDKRAQKTIRKLIK